MMYDDETAAESLSITLDMRRFIQQVNYAFSPCEAFNAEFTACSYTSPSISNLAGEESDEWD
jgi:hypothetical protein